MPSWWTLSAAFVVSWLGWMAVDYAVWWWRIHSSLRSMPEVKHR